MTPESPVPPTAEDKARAHALACELQDAIVQQAWRSEEGRARYRAAATPLMPAVYWSRADLENRLATLLAQVRVEEREPRTFTIDELAALGDHSPVDVSLEETWGILDIARGREDGECPVSIRKVMELVESVLALRKALRAAKAL